jgi:hypothetical protein
MSRTMRAYEGMLQPMTTMALPVQCPAGAQSEGAEGVTRRQRKAACGDPQERFDGGLRSLGPQGRRG